jgi:hypothetical protein
MIRIHFGDLTSMFDCIYFRLAHFFFKRDGLSVDTAIFAISIIQFIFLIIALILLTRMLGIDDVIRAYLRFFSITITVASLGLIPINRKRFKGKYLIFRERWLKKELGARKAIGWFFVILSFMFPLFVLPILGKFQ